MTSPTCQVDGCDRSRFARSMCQTHYKRWQRNGNPGPTDVRIYARREPIRPDFKGLMFWIPS